MINLRLRRKNIKINFMIYIKWFLITLFVGSFVGYGLYFLGTLIWGLTVCDNGSMDAMFKVSLIISLALALFIITGLFIGFMEIEDGVKMAVFRILFPAVFVMMTLAGTVYLYGYCEPVLTVETSVPEYAHCLIVFISGILLLAAVASCFILGFVNAVECSFFYSSLDVDLTVGNGFKMFFDGILRILIPIGVLVFGILAWDYIVKDYWTILEDSDITAFLIPASIIAVPILGISACIALLCNRKFFAAGFIFGLFLALIFVFCIALGVIWLMSYMNEYYVYIILGFIGFYLLTGIIYCLCRLKKIRGIISYGVRKYWKN